MLLSIFLFCTIKLIHDSNLSKKKQRTWRNITWTEATKCLTWFNLYWSFHGTFFYRTGHPRNGIIWVAFSKKHVMKRVNPQRLGLAKIFTSLVSLILIPPIYKMQMKPLLQHCEALPQCLLNLICPQQPHVHWILGNHLWEDIVSLPNLGMTTSHTCFPVDKNIV